MGITPQAFAALQRRLNGIQRTATPIFENRCQRTQKLVVLGIDPSLRGTGFGIIRSAKNQTDTLTYGTIRCPAEWEHSRCLVEIVAVLRRAIREYRPTVCVIEGLFYAQNLRTSLIMGEARGASLFAAAEAGLEIYELASRKVKQAIVGYGAAQKGAVAKMVQRMLGLNVQPESDAADALALALAHMQANSRFALANIKRI